MSARYGKHFADMWAGQPVQAVKSVWASDLADYTGEELKRGLEACKSSRFPPTLPEFAMLCRPSMDYEAAFTEAVREMQNRRSGRPESWSKPAVYWAAVALGNDLMAYPYAPLRVRWKSALDAAFAEGRNTIPDAAVALPSPGRVMINKDDAHKRIQELASKLSLR